MEIEKIIKKCKELTTKEIEDVNFWVNMRLPREIKEEVKKRITIEFIKKPRENPSGGWKCINCPPEKEIEFENCYDIKIKIGEKSFILPPIDGVLGCLEQDQSLEDIAQKIVFLIENEWGKLKVENKKVYCKNLYQKYTELKDKIDYAFQVQDYKRGKEIEARPVPPIEDMELFHKIKKELDKTCLPFLDLKPEEWFDIKG